MTILQHSLGETSVLRVHGSLRAPVDTALRLEVDALLRRGQRRLLLDLVGVSGLDAAGVGELVRVYNMAVAANGTLRVAHVLGKFRELLVRVGLIDLLTMDAEPGFKNENMKLVCLDSVMTHRCDPRRNLAGTRSSSSLVNG